LSAAGGTFTLDDAMAFGLGVMRLPPAAFWGMTVREFLAAAGASIPEARFDRERLHQLMHLHPD
jgi:uncharacterized phage protein (TIGR02216 family)